jgi:hypothetical protein
MEQTMTDAMGNVVPTRYVKPYDRVRDAQVRLIVADWLRQRAALEDLVARTLGRLAKVVAARGGDVADKGNIQVSTFDGLLTVSCDQRYDIHLDDRVKQARDMLLDYARGIAGKVDGDDGQALLAIIEETFRPSANNLLSSARVLSLMRMEVRAQVWRDAIEMLRQSIETRKGKRYLRVSVRPDRQHDAVPIRLDAANCWPVEGVDQAAYMSHAKGRGRRFGELIISPAG